jgi:hypothetical protein
MLLASLLSHDQGESANRIAVFTIWPALIGWMGVSGVVILWKLGLLSERRKHASFMGKTYYSALFLVGVLFIVGAVWLLAVVAVGTNGA